MKLLWRTLLLFLTILAILTVHIFVVNFLPFPFNHINIIVSLLLLLLSVTSNKKALWLALVISYFSELFSSIPFGIGAAAIILSLVIINWFQLNILTNRSVSMVFFSALFGITLYRTLFVIFLTANNYFFNKGILPYKEIMADAGWEILFSSLALFLFYLVGAKLLKRLNRAYTKSERVYGD